MVLVRDVMTTAVLSFHPADSVQDAMQRMVDTSIDGAPVVDDGGRVVGLLSGSDLVVQVAQVHAPTVISIFGAYLELPSKHRQFEEDLRKALGSAVSDVMDDDPVTCDEDDTLEQAATLMHDEEVSRLPVTRDGVLVGIISQTDILKAILQGRTEG